MALYCELDSMVSESDVEQKFIYPFLTHEPPMGLGIKDSEILTKHILRRKHIGKGTKQKYYYPDYVVSIRGISTLVVEAKEPNQPLDDGYSEARLYAQEINALYPHRINACQFVIASNGKEMWVGYADQADPLLRLTYDDFAVENKSFCELIDVCSRERLLAISNKHYAELRGGARFDSPVAQLGGKRVQNEELIENSFGRTLVFENRRVFDPESEEDRTAIVENAYISSQKREQHAEPMYKEIKRFELPSRKNSTRLSTEMPEELVDKLSEKLLNNQEAYSLMLLIGNVGSGKTTFTRYFKHVFLAKKHPELAAKCEWVFINMNLAPVSSEEIYSWLKMQIIDSIKRGQDDLDFDDLAVIKKVFRRKISSFDKGLGSLLRNDESAYNRELYSILTDLMKNPDEYLTSLLFFIKENFSKIPIIVLDNCDKRNKDEQLLMFEVAQWLRTQYKCIVMLPMRDTTYDMYRSEPPLDTVVRDLVFRIDPPDLLRVLQARLDYITRITEQVSHEYGLDNGISVPVKRSELVEYFKCIMIAIRNDEWIKTLFYKLADRNTRNGIQIFEDFCKSGHMKTSDILAMRVLSDTAEIPTYRFENVLLRKNRRYYKGDESNFINLFASDYNDDFPDPFVRVDILYWLHEAQKREGPTKEKGLFPVGEMLRDLQIQGHRDDVVYREMDYMIKRGLIFCESYVNQIRANDLIKLAVPGGLHFRMLRNVSYLAACAEDTLFKNSEIMIKISRRLRDREQNSKLIAVMNARDLVDYLCSYREEYILGSEELFDDGKVSMPYDMQESKRAIDKWITVDQTLRNTIDLIDTHATGTEVKACIIKKVNGGVICSINDSGIKGFIGVRGTEYQFSSDMYENVKLGDYLKCEIVEYDFVHESFQLRYLDRQ